MLARLAAYLPGAGVDLVGAVVADTGMQMRGVVAIDPGRTPGSGVVQDGIYSGVSRVGFHRREPSE